MHWTQWLRTELRCAGAGSFVFAFLASGLSVAWCVACLLALSVVYPCFSSSRYFTTDKVLDDHVKSKVHKKRVKLAAEKPYSQAEANAAAGMGATKKD
jgi:hypothetical protein